MLRPDISQNYAVKSAIEQLFGQKAWQELKDTTSIKVWRSYVARVIDAIEISIEQSVHVRDDAWIADVSANLSRGRNETVAATSIDDLLSAFTATLLRQVFLQLGCCPDRQSLTHVTLAPVCPVTNSAKGSARRQTGHSKRAARL
jgi:hypothetical protein